MRPFSDIRKDQIECVDFICDSEDTLVWADIGAGKTVIAETAMLRLRGRWIVFAPLRVADSVWVQETDEWTHLGPLNVVAATSGPHSRGIIAQNRLIDVVVTNYDNLKWWCDSGLFNQFDGIVFDEVDKLKDPRTIRFKTLKKEVKQFKHRIGMTGTPTPERLLDLWSQVYVIDGGDSFGQSFDKWKKAHFYPYDYEGYDWRPFPVVTDKYVTKALDGLVFRIKSPWTGTHIETPLRELTFPPDVDAIYRTLEKQLYLRLKDGKVLSAANMAVLSGKLSQIAAGFSYVVDDDPDVPRETIWHSKAKYDELDSLISELQGQQLMIVYHFNAELDELKRRYGDRLWEPTEEGITAWNAGEAELLAVQPGSAGHGLNLQHSGAHHVVYLTQPWSAGKYHQVIGRLNRSGQVNQVYVHRIVVADSVDLDVIASVVNKWGNQSDLLDEMMRRTEQRYG